MAKAVDPGDPEKEMVAEWKEKTRGLVHDVDEFKKVNFTPPVDVKKSAFKEETPPGFPPEVIEQWRPSNS